MALLRALLILSKELLLLQVQQQGELPLVRELLRQNGLVLP